VSVVVQQPASRKSNKLIAVLIVLVAALVVLGGTVILAVLLRYVVSGGPGMLSGNRVAIIRVTGLISTGDVGRGLFIGGAGSEEIIRQLKKARSDDSIKAIVLRINSPGGSAAGAQEIYRELMKIRNSKKFKKYIVASMGDVAASGGYYIASAADKIVADPATLTGSIGVISQSLVFEELMKKVGVEAVTVKRGPFKDMGSSFREPRPEEQKLMQAAIDDVYSQFVKDVAAGREKLNEEQVRRLADGRIYTGSQAKQKGLVDELGNLEDAVSAAAKAAGIKGTPHVVEMGRRSPLQFLMTETAAAAGQAIGETLVRSNVVDTLNHILEQPSFRIR